MSPEERVLPRAVVVAEKGTLRLSSLNPAALALGLEAGLSLADARARHPALRIGHADPDGMRRTLVRFADACERYTPLLALDGTDGLLLDVTGCAHLFGGEAELVGDLLRRVRTAGFSARAALAATPGGAFAFARFGAGKGGLVVPEAEDLAVLLAPLPLAALRLDPAEVAALARLGLARVGDLCGKPRAPLAARFGARLLARRDAAIGAAPEALAYRFPPPLFCAERSLMEPVEQVEAVLDLTAHLASSLAAAMARHGAGARRLDLVLFRVDGKVTRLAIGTSRPLRDAARIRRLFAEKVAAIDSLDPGFGFDLLRLCVREAAPLDARQESFGGDGDEALALDGLIDRLAIRFGAHRVTRIVAEDRHVPEDAARLEPAGRGGGTPALAAARLMGQAAFAFAGPEGAGPMTPLLDEPADLCGPHRPLRLLEKPEPVEAVAEVPDGPPVRFRWRRRLHQVVRSEGPERIAGEWWHAPPPLLPGPPGQSMPEGPPTRDYFRVETAEGTRLWLYRDGLYGRETMRPAWFVHGLLG